MRSVVIDASALLLAVLGRGGDAEVLRDQMPGLRCHAPHLIDAEVGNVLRRHEHAGLLSTVEARLALTTAATLVSRRHPHTDTIARVAWDLRHNLTFYDALYVALASMLDVPLVTCDARLAAAPGLPCTVELV